MYLTIESKDPSVVISGNEKVVRPRLADAQFFFETDKKKTLESRLESLDTVLFQKQLGTLKDKSERISELAEYIAEQLGADKDLAKRAGLLSKNRLNDRNGNGIYRCTRCNGNALRSL